MYYWLLGGLYGVYDVERVEGIHLLRKDPLSIYATRSHKQILD